MKKRNFISSIKYAIAGIRHFFLTEPNSRIHFLASVFVVAAGFWFRIDRFSWIAVIICIGLVYTTEIINTAVEKIMDMISPEKNEQVRVIKDVAAGAVLIAAFISLITGILVFYPYLKP